jgi:hypothetical protein
MQLQGTTISNTLWIQTHKVAKHSLPERKRSKESDQKKQINKKNSPKFEALISKR